MDKRPEIERIENPELRDLVRDIYDKALNQGFVDRGDPSGWDYQVSDLTTDNTWRDLDLSLIVPEGAKAVLLSVAIKDAVADSWVSFRKNGNTNNYNLNAFRTQVANIQIRQTLIVACDTDRKIEYKGKNLTFTTLNILVIGWLF